MLHLLKSQADRTLMINHQFSPFSAQPTSACFIWQCIPIEMRPRKRKAALAMIEFWYFLSLSTTCTTFRWAAIGVDRVCNSIIGRLPLKPRCPRAAKLIVKCLRSRRRLGILFDSSLGFGSKSNGIWSPSLCRWSADFNQKEKSLLQFKYFSQTWELETWKSDWEKTGYRERKGSHSCICFSQKGQGAENSVISR